MRGDQIDQLCWDWLHHNYGKEFAMEYVSYSLVIPGLNSAHLNEALDELRQTLCLIFGPEQSFGSTDYYEARQKLGLPDDRDPVPDVFVRAFVGT
jgi:hypothetical protein